MHVGPYPKPGRWWPGFLLPALLLATGVRAQVQATADYLARMDTNHDGRVALLEYQDWLTYAFDAMDRDRDGVLAGAELPGNRGKPIWRSAHRARLADRFGRQDGNHDGYLDTRELSAPPQ